MCNGSPVNAALLHSLLLVVTAAIWGAAFLAQKLGADHLGPYTFTALRSLLGGLTLLAMLAVRGILRRAGSPRVRKSESLRVREPGSSEVRESGNLEPEMPRPRLRDSAVGGFWCGLWLFAATILQQIGIHDTTPGVSGFLTANYVLLVPILGLFLGTRPGGHVWVAAVIAMAGLYLICVDEQLSVGRGEAFTLACSLVFAVQILSVAHFASRCDVLVLSCAEFFTGAALGLPFLLLPSEAAHLSAASLRAAAPAIAFCGVFSSGVAYTLQNIAQGKVPPAIASILMSLESAFALLFGWLFLNESLPARRLLGCALVFAAVLLAQLCDALRRR